MIDHTGRTFQRYCHSSSKRWLAPPCRFHMEVHMQHIRHWWASFLLHMLHYNNHLLPALASLNCASIKCTWVLTHILHRYLDMRYNDIHLLLIPLSGFRRQLWLRLRIRPLWGSCHRGICPNGMFLWNPIWSDKQLYKLCTYFGLLLGRAGHILHMCQRTLCTFWDF